MRRFAVALVLCGCYRATTTTAAPQSALPDVRFAIVVGKTVQILRTTNHGLVVERTTPVPDVVSRMFWVGPDPAVWLDMSHGERGEGFPNFFYDQPPKPDGPHQNEMGLVTAAGFVTLKRIEWPPAKRPTGDFAEDMSEVTEPNVALVASKDALWQKRCRWYGGPDGGWCSYEYARRFPEPVVFSADVHEDPGRLPLPKVEASKTVAVGHGSRLRHPEDPDMPEYENKQALLICQPNGGAKIEYPPAGELDDNIIGEPVWISTEPPMFLTSEAELDAGMGRGPPPDKKIWEACTISTRYDAVTVGPDDIVVLSGREVSVLWRGREIGHIASGGSHPVLAPR